MTFPRIALRTGVSPIGRRGVVLPSMAIPVQRGQELVIRLLVPGEPVPKARPRVTQKRVYTPRRTHEAEARLLSYLKAQYPRLRPVSGALSVSVECYFRGKPRVDVDNLLKLPLDAMNTIVWVDDSQIVEAHVRKHMLDSQPRTDIHVWLLKDVGL